MPEKIEVDGELAFANPYYMGDGEPLPEMDASKDRGSVGTWRNPRPMGGNVAWRMAVALCLRPGLTSEGQVKNLILSTPRRGWSHSVDRGDDWDRVMADVLVGNTWGRYICTRAEVEECKGWQKVDDALEPMEEAVMA